MSVISLVIGLSGISGVIYCSWAASKIPIDQRMPYIKAMAVFFLGSMIGIIVAASPDNPPTKHPTTASKDFGYSKRDLRWMDQYGTSPSEMKAIEKVCGDACD